MDAEEGGKQKGRDGRGIDEKGWIERKEGRREEGMTR